MQDLISDSPEIMMLLSLVFFMILFEVWRQNMLAAGLQVEDVIHAVIIVLMWTFAKAVVRMILDERQNAVRDTVYRARLLVQMCGFAQETITRAEAVFKGAHYTFRLSSWNSLFREEKTSRTSAFKIVTTNKSESTTAPAQTKNGEPMAAFKTSESNAGPGSVAHKPPKQTSEHTNERKATSVMLGEISDSINLYTNSLPYQSSPVSWALPPYII